MEGQSSLAEDCKVLPGQGRIWPKGANLSSEQYAAFASMFSMTFHPQTLWVGAVETWRVKTEPAKHYFGTVLASGLRTDAWYQFTLWSRVLVISDTGTRGRIIENHTLQLLRFKPEFE